MLESHQIRRSEYKKYPLYVTVIGMNYLQTPINRPHGLATEQIFVCKQGMGELIINDSRSIIQSGDLFIVRRYEDHIYHALSHNWTLDLLGCNGFICKTLMDKFHMQSGKYAIADQHVFTHYLQELSSIGLSQQSRHEQLLRKSQILYLLLTELSFIIKPIHEHQNTTTNTTVSAIISFLEEHFHENISLQDLGAAIHRSPEYLCSIFKETQEETIISYLNKLRISQARLLLERYPERSVSEIGKACGFNSASYFGKIFKQICGVTPHQYRLANVTDIDYIQE